MRNEFYSLRKQVQEEYSRIEKIVDAVPVSTKEEDIEELAIRALCLDDAKQLLSRLQSKLVHSGVFN